MLTRGGKILTSMQTTVAATPKYNNYHSGYFIFQYAIIEAPRLMPTRGGKHLTSMHT